MAQQTSDQGPDKNNTPGLDAIAAELQRESEKLRQLAEELKAREAALAEMQANYPHFKQALFAMLREKAERELDPLLADKDLETLAREEGSLPLEAFIADLEEPAEGSRNGG